MIRGIGPIYAKRVVQGFEEAAFDLIEQQPDRLCQRRMKTSRWADVARPILGRSVPAAPSAWWRDWSLPRWRWVRCEAIRKLG